MSRTVLVRYKGPSGASPQVSADGVTIYIFSGNAPVRVRNEDDIAKFERKALKNPDIWEVVPVSLTPVPIKRIMEKVRGGATVQNAVKAVEAEAAIGTKSMTKVG